MRITFVLNHIDRVGGVRVAFEYANHLQKRGHDISIVYPAVNLVYLKRLSILALAIWTLSKIITNIRNVLRGDRPQPFTTQSALIKIPALHSRFERSVEKKVPDADVVIATAWETAYDVDRFSVKKGQKVYFIQAYEIWDVLNNSECWKEAKRLRRGDDMLTLGIADVIPKQRRLRESKAEVERSYKLPLKKITISNWLKKLVEDKFGERVEGVIPDGVNFDVFFRESDRREDDEHVKILLPYSPALSKGFNDGFNAFRLIQARHPDARFAVFGRKLLVNAELRKMPEWVEYHNINSDAQLRELYNDAHVFVSPSWLEGFALPPMEAMACGCAVVTTDASGFAEYLTNGETAFVVPIQEPEALAQSVCILIEDANERRRMAENGYEFVKRFTWEDAAVKLEAVLKKNLTT